MKDLIRISVETNLSDLIDSIVYKNAGIEFVKKLDSTIADYFFTETLAKYFIKECIKEMKADQEDLASLKQEIVSLFEKYSFREN